MCHFILDHNSCVTWWISTFCAPLKTGKNTLSGITKFATLPQLCLYTTWEYLKTHKTARPWATASCLIEPVMRNLHSKSSNVHQFQFLLANSLNSLLAENLLHSLRFLIKILSPKLNIRPIIHLHIKHSSHTMWRNYDVVTKEEPLSK